MRSGRREGRNKEVSRHLTSTIRIEGRKIILVNTTQVVVPKMCFRFVIPANANLAMPIEGRPKQDLEGEGGGGSTKSFIGAATLRRAPAVLRPALRFR